MDSLCENRNHSNGKVYSYLNNARGDIVHAEPLPPLDRRLLTALENILRRTVLGVASPDR